MCQSIMSSPGEPREKERDARVSREVEFGDLGIPICSRDMQDGVADDVLYYSLPSALRFGQQFRAKLYTDPRDFCLVDAFVEEPFKDIDAPFQRCKVQARLPRLRIGIAVVPVPVLVYGRQAEREADEVVERRVRRRAGRERSPQLARRVDERLHSPFQGLTIGHFRVCSDAWRSVRRLAPLVRGGARRRASEPHISAAIGSNCKSRPAACVRTF